MAENRVAIVTGAGGMRGIGRAIALRYARQGLKLALVDVPRSKDQIPPAEIEAGWRDIESVAEEVGKLGSKAICVYADIANEQDVETACQRTIAAFGQIDVLVNNARAGIGRDRALAIDLDPAEWDRVMRVNARGTFLFARTVARHMVARGGPGHIINMSSQSGKRGLAMHSAYVASKFAVNGLTQCLAIELGKYNINVNAICPGVVNTGRYSLEETLAAESAGISLDEVAHARFEKHKQKVILPRIAVADDIAGVAAFLISPDAVHITGQSLNVCGGESFH